MTDKTETDIYLENLRIGEWEIDGSQLLDVAIELSNELKRLQSAVRKVCIKAFNELQELVPDQ